MEKFVSSQSHTDFQKSLGPVVSPGPLGLNAREASCPNEKPKVRPPLICLPHLHGLPHLPY